MNVAITGMLASSGNKYFPKWTEISITLAIIASGFLVFALAVKYLPIFPVPPLHEPALSSARLLRRASFRSSPMSHPEDRSFRMVAGKQISGSLSSKLLLLLVSSMASSLALLAI